METKLGDKFNVGDVVLVRITGEPVYLLEKRFNPDAYWLTRRAVQGQDGIEYQTEGFTPGELQTEMEKLEEEFQKQLTFYVKRNEFDALKRAADEKQKQKGLSVAAEQPNLFN